MPDRPEASKATATATATGKAKAAAIAVAWAWVFAAGLSAAGQTAAAASTDPYRAITVVSWGGPYELSQVKAYFEPFTRATGIRIDLERYDGGLDELRRQVSGGDVDWDLMDMTMADNRAACRQGLLEPIDHSRLHPAPDGTPAEQDFIDGALTECGGRADRLRHGGRLQPRCVPGRASRPDRGHFRSRPVSGDAGAPARPRGEPRVGPAVVRSAAPGPVPAPQHGAGPSARLRAPGPDPRPRGVVDVGGTAGGHAHQRGGGDRLGVQRAAVRRGRRSGPSHRDHLGRAGLRARIVGDPPGHPASRRRARVHPLRDGDRAPRRTGEVHRLRAGAPVPR